MPAPAVERQIFGARAPFGVQGFFHPCIGALEDIQIAVATRPRIGFRQEAAFRMLPGMPQRLHQRGIIEFGQSLLQHRDFTAARRADRA